jgi:hypothetical protein
MKYVIIALIPPQAPTTLEFGANAMGCHFETKFLKSGGKFK